MYARGGNETWEITKERRALDGKKLLEMRVNNPM
jgi:hypothetical protein